MTKRGQRLKKRKFDGKTRKTKTNIRQQGANKSLRKEEIPSIKCSVVRRERKLQRK